MENVRRVPSRSAACGTETVEILRIIAHWSPGPPQSGARERRTQPAAMSRADFKLRPALSIRNNRRTTRRNASNRLRGACRAKNLRSPAAGRCRRTFLHVAVLHRQHYLFGRAAEDTLQRRDVVEQAHRLMIADVVHAPGSAAGRSVGRERVVVRVDRRRRVERATTPSTMSLT